MSAITIRKLPDDVKSEVQGDVDALQSDLAGDDDDAVKSAFEKLSQSQGKLGEAIYASQQQPAGANPGNPGEDASASGTDGGSSSDEDVVDAEVIDDEDEKK